MNYANDYAGLIFDCDGTLTDSMPLHYVAWKTALGSHGIEFTEARFYAMAGMPTVKIVETLSREQSIEVNPQKTADTKEELFFEQLAKLQPRQQVCELAVSHRGRIPIAVASGGDRQSVTKQLAQISMSEYFDVIVTAEDTERHKPEPDVFLEAASRMGVLPLRCLVFEDADLGMEAARRAQMDAVDVRTWTFVKAQSVIAATSPLPDDKSTRADL